MVIYLDDEAPKVQNDGEKQVVTFAFMTKYIRYQVAGRVTSSTDLWECRSAAPLRDPTKGFGMDVHNDVCGFKTANQHSVKVVCPQG